MWKHNDVPVYVHEGNWEDIFRLLASGRRRIDYFPRAAIEISDQLRAHPDLEVAPLPAAGLSG